MLNKNFFYQNKFLFGILILIIFSFLISFDVYVHVYDGHHHGLIFSNAIDLLEGKKPYKEIWIQYGFLTTFLHSLIINIFGNKLLYINIFTIAVYITSVLFISLTVNKLTNNFYAFLTFFIIICNHPIPWLPWANYISLLFLTIAIYLLQFKLNKFQYLAGFFLGLVCLSRENYFIFIFPFILILFVLPFLHKGSKALSYRIAFNVFFGFLIPLFIFFIYLFFNDLFFDWFKYLILPFLYVESVHNTTILNLIINFVIFFLSSSFFNFISEPQYLLISLILITSTIYVFRSLFLSNNINFNILLIGILCIFSSIVSINYELFRLYTSVITGSILLIYLISKIKDNQFKNFAIFFLLSISSYSIIFYPEGNNKVFKNINKENSYEFSNISYFKNQKWEKRKIDPLIQIYSLQKKIKNKCKIEYAGNFTFDAFYFIALESKNIHIVPMIRAGDFDKSAVQEQFFKDGSFLIKINNELVNENIILLISENNYFFDGSKLILNNNYTKKEISLNTNKEKPDILRLYYPKICLN